MKKKIVPLLMLVLGVALLVWAVLILKDGQETVDKVKAAGPGVCGLLLTVFGVVGWVLSGKQKGNEGE